MHSRCLLGPYREIIFIRRELLLQAFYYRRILEKEDRAIASLERIIYLCLGSLIGFGGDDFTKRVFYDFPKILVAFTQ